MRRLLRVIRQLEGRWQASRLMIGVAVSPHSMRAVAVRGTRALWAVSAERSQGEPLDREIEALLRSSPAARGWIRRRAVLAAAPQYAQLKLLPNLPRVSNTMLAGVVRESPGRFFRKNGVPLDTGGVSCAGDFVWAAAYERPLLAAVERGCTAVRLTLVAAVPSVLAVARASVAPTIHWFDDDAWFAIVRDQEGAPPNVRACLGPRDVDATPQAVPGLQSLGLDAWTYADAYGAAVGRGRESVAIRLSRTRSRHYSRRRLVAAAAACAVLWTAALVVPGMLRVRQAHRAARVLADLAASRHSYGAAMLRLDAATKQLDELARFDATRDRMTVLLDQLATALPADAAIIALRADSLGGSLVAIGPDAAELIDALEHVSCIASPEIVGPITHEVTQGTTTAPTPGPARPTAQRVTVRFAFSPVSEARE